MRALKGSAAEFGERVMLLPTPKASRVEASFVPDLLFGLVLTTNDALIATEDGIISRGRSFVRMPDGEQRDGALFAAVRGLPWRP